MPEHIKDSRQKEKAVKYCLVNGMLSYLEVNVNNRSEISDEAQTLTDIDVLGVRVRHDGSTTRTIFDCKTERRMRPVNRAFWAAGVLKYTSCDEAFVILERRAVEAHRLSAKVIAVHLFDEEMFDKYAEASNIDYLAINSYCSKLETWRQSALIFEK